MSAVLLALAITSACMFLFYFIISVRACAVGTGFNSVRDFILIVIILGVSATLALWLGPIGLAGIGLL